MPEGAAAVPAPCADILPSVQIDGRSRLVAPEDLVRLRDVGGLDLISANSDALALSPDGNRIAFQIRQASAEANDYCLAMVVLDLGTGGVPHIIDRGGELIRRDFSFRGKAGFPTGIPLPIAPRWAPNGHWIAFLKRVDGRTQVWRASADGTQGTLLSRAEIDVDDFRITADGNGLVMALRPALYEARRRIEEEELQGFLYDDRYSPMSSSRPFPADSIQREVFFQDIESGEIRPARANEIALLDGPLATRPAAVAANVTSAGRETWLEPEQAGGRLHGLILKATNLAGEVRECRDQACRGRISNPHWTSDGSAVRFFQKDGWLGGTTSIYEWRPDQDSLQRLYTTEEALADCVSRQDELLCLHESATQPRRIVRLVPQTGSMHLLFDLNPEFANLEMGRVERLHVRNSFGLEAHADLVLPPGYRPGQRYPIIVVQYQSHGFLRGGTGDEYPIHAFASRGYAVLSVNRPSLVGLAVPPRDENDVERRNLQDNFADRRSVQEVIAQLVQQVIDRGIADPERIGITGLSDGSASLQYALLNSDIFAAAASSSAGFEPAFNAFVGPAAAREFQAQGYPGILDDAPAFWRQISLTPNAERMRTPLLMQLPDNEYIPALIPVTALREAEAPVELFIFAGEYHIKWQPAHRLAIYRRSLDWFDFWLRGIENDASSHVAEYARWQEMRDNQCLRLIGNQAPWYCRADVVRMRQEPQ